MQIQAYLDNVFDVGGLLEDAETKNVALEKVEELEEHLSHVCEHGGMRGCSLLGPGQISDTGGSLSCCHSCVPLPSSQRSCWTWRTRT